MNLKSRLLFIILLNYFFINAQCPSGNVTFQTQGQVDNFLVQYPDCTRIYGNLLFDSNASSPITNVSGLINLTKIDGNFTINYNIWMDTLYGLNNLEEVGGTFFIYDSWITDISALSNLHTIGADLYLGKSTFSDLTVFANLTNLGGSFYYTNENLYAGPSNLDLNLTTINGDFTMSYSSPGSGGEITIGGNASIVEVTGDFSLSGAKVVDVQIFNDLTTVGGDFSLENIKIPNVDGFNSLETVGQGFHIRNMYEVSNLDGFSSINFIGVYLILSYNYSLTDISGLSGVGAINGTLRIDSNSELVNLSGLENISEINNELIIKGNDNLNDISGISHIDPNTITNLEIKYNPLLSFCNEDNICYYLDEGFDSTILNNASGCNNDSEIIFECNLENYNLITGTVSQDVLSNNCTSGSTSIDNIQVNTTNGTSTFSTFTDINGTYYLFVPEGTFTTSVVENILYYEANPFEYTHTFSDVGNQETADFCIIPIPGINDLKIKIIPLGGSPRPGLDMYYKLIFRNVGTTTLDGAIEFEYDETRIDFIEAVPQEASSNINLLEWDFLDLAPFETREIVVKFYVLPPPVNDSNDILAFTATVSPIDGDFVPEDNVFSFNDIIVNSQDPNDKQVLEGSQVLIEEAGDYLNYVIRFQNIGNASAINVEIEDVLSNNLDIESFVLTSLSHPGIVQIENNLLRVVFEGINLPDSTTNEPESHGYVSFSIRSLPSLEVGDSVENTADIYFDFNPAIVTNTTITTFVNEILGAPEVVLDQDIKIYPNPTLDLLYIEIPDSVSVKMVTLMSLDSKILFSKPTTEVISVSEFTKGIYFLKIETTNGIFIKRILKE